MKRKLVVFLLATVVVFFAAALPVSAATTADGFVYDGSDGMLWITDYVGSGGAVTIPSAINDDHVAGIGAYAFAGCSNITSMTIPDSTLFIESYAFSNCTGMTSLTVGENVDSIGDNAFENCINLSAILWNTRNVSVSIDYGPFSNAGTAGTGISVTFGDTVEVIPAKLFVPEKDSLSPNIVSVTLGEKVRLIDKAAFKNCGITSIIIPDSVKTISSYAFYGCNLTSVSIGTGVEYIYPYAFCYCPLTSVTIPDNIIGIESYAFDGCSQLASVTFGSNLEYCSSYAFLNCPKLNEISVPRNMLYICDGAFGYNYDNEDLYKGDLTITGYTYSAAEQYAKDNGFTFNSLGGVFADVEEGSWYEPYVNDLVAQGIFSGYKDDDGGYLFKPEKSITRAEFAMILARASGDDLTPYENKTSFTDVEASGWSGAGIEWAYQNEIVYGTGSGKYAPNTSISREDMALMIYRFADYQSIALNSTVGEVTFTDQSKIADYALNAVSSLQKAGIINGSESQGKLYFNPKNSATRAEAARMISAFLDL